MLLTTGKNIILRHIGQYPAKYCQKRKFYLSRNVCESIKDILNAHKSVGNRTTVKGWIKSTRNHKEICFLDINDGSCLQHLQVILPQRLGRSDHTFGSCVEIEGTIVESQGHGQKVELQADSVSIVGKCDPVMYPFKARERHPPDYERQYLHLRPRSNTFSSLLRVRSAATRAIQEFFWNSGFYHIHTPIISSNDCEGAGEVFQVEPAWVSLDGGFKSTDKDPFFNSPAFLAVSGQLHLEVATGAFQKVYTFGPTFRAENSRGRHHLSEFYMVEAEMAFIKDVEDICSTVEILIKDVSKSVLEAQSEDVEFFLRYVSPDGHRENINNILHKSFIRMSYKEAVEILQKESHCFKFKVQWGCDLQKEHERHLVAHCGNVPVFITDYPSDIKPFYARLNEDNKTVGAVDLLCPGVGEVCGGSLREDRLHVLQPRLQKLQLIDNFQWYLDLRRYGSAPHGGFGIGFERYLQTLLGIWNIKDTIPFPRSTHSCPL